MPNGSQVTAGMTFGDVPGAISETNPGHTHPPTAARAASSALGWLIADYGRILASVAAGACVSLRAVAIDSPVVFSRCMCQRVMACGSRASFGSRSGEFRNSVAATWVTGGFMRQSGASSELSPR
ncbi:MAG TPA: hypothetical protein VGI58_19395 [Streptosporangiaceae bacterium]|jgi:hypothetical protein